MGLEAIFLIFAFIAFGLFMVWTAYSSNNRARRDRHAADSDKDKHKAA